MQTRADFESELQIRLLSANNSTNFGAARLTKLIQDAELWATSLHFWPQLSRARVTDTFAGQEYYDYPDDFLTDSINRLYINGKRYDRKNFGDFRDYVDAPTATSFPPDQTKNFFANYGRQYFVFPVPTVTGPDDNLIIWGNIQSPGLPLSTSTTIFSLWDDSGNEAIVQKAFSVAMQRIAPSEAAAAKQDALGLLAIMYKRVTDQLQKDQRLNHPFFQVFDMFGAQSGMATIGNFGLNVNIVS